MFILSQVTTADGCLVHALKEMGVERGVLRHWGGMETLSDTPICVGCEN